MRFLRLNNFLRLFLCAFITLATVLVFRSLSVDKLTKITGKRQFYLNSASSKALIKDELSLFDLFSVTGESVAFSLQGENGEEKARELIAEYNGKVLFTERAGGTLSYYCFAKGLGKGILLDGVFVNLHIAIRGDTCAVGTPILFGGF